ncbi:MAG: MarR family transcriptional regulator [Ancalomicrobiaceae bacterium]|nr:MarR family transcriptional regulator [Ancalomicrobiaceae bacterium]
MSTLSASDLTSHLGYWLRYVSNHVSHSFASKIAAKDVTVAEWAVMRTLYTHDQMAPSAIAADMGMTRGAITKLADRLIVKGLLVRTANPGDGRAQTLALTNSARALVPELAALADQNDAEFFDHLTSEERATLERLLKEIVARRGLTTMPVD